MSGPLSTDEIEEQIAISCVFQQMANMDGSFRPTEREVALMTLAVRQWRLNFGDKKL